MKKIIKIFLLSLTTFIGIALLGVFIFGPAIADQKMNRVKHYPSLEISAQTQTLHSSLFIADLHADSLLWDRDLLAANDYGHVDIPRLQQGNVALQMFTTVTKTPAGLNYHSNSGEGRDNTTLLALVQGWPMATWRSLSARALYQSERLHHFAQQAPEQLLIIKSQADLKRLVKLRNTAPVNTVKPVGALLGTEGSHALEGDLANIDKLYKAGFRMMSLQHFFDNQLGGSLHGQSKAGLTTFGKAAVTEMDRLGIMIDVSHSSPQVVRDVLALSSRPLIVSHTGIYSHCASERNIADTLMQRIAAKGGLIGIGFWQGAVCDDSPLGVAKAIQAAVTLLGEDAVGLGSDYDGAVTTGFDASQMQQLSQALVSLGMTDATLAKVMGGNQLRFMMANLPEK